MQGHDARRTNRSDIDGPHSYTAGSPRNWSYACTAAAVINMQPVCSNDGVFFGSWGLLRRDQALTPDQWVKTDGKYFGLRLHRQPSRQDQEIFRPFDPHPVPVGYLFPGRPKLTRDVQWCGANNNYLVSFYNGTIEGTAAIDPDTGIHYVGRGDGELFAIDPTTGAVRWQYITFNPRLPSDPDGGGEIVGGPLLAADRHLYFATYAAPWPSTSKDPAYETNAVYSVDRAGKLRWRYPSQAETLENPLLTPLAMSPDGKTAYAATWAGDTSVAGRLLAFDLTQPPGATDRQRLKWSLDLVNVRRWFRPRIWAFRLAVDASGTIYVAGGQAQFGGLAPVLIAVRDRGNRGAFAWQPEVVELQGYPSTKGALAAGIALYETGRTLERIYVTTTHVRSANGVGGVLSVVDPRTGRIVSKFDPSTLPTPGVGGMTEPVLGNDETVYVGIRGKHDLFFPGKFVDGWMYGLHFDPIRQSWRVRFRFRVDGLLDWAAPAIGPTGGLYFGSSDRFSPTEQAKWFAPTQRPPRANPKFYAIFE